MKKVDLAKLDVAIKYVERIAEGCNPINHTPVENDDILNNPNIIRCMYFIKDVLEEIRYNDGVIGGKRERASVIPFPTKVLEDFTYKEDLSITHVLSQIYEPLAGMNVKKISVTKVTSVLKEEGDLLEERDPETGKLSKVPSDKGKVLGIYMAEREFNGRIYQTVMYNRSAQEYIVQLLKQIIGKAK